MAEHRRQGGERHTGCDRGDSKAVAQPLGAGLRAADGGLVHEAADMARGAGARHGPQPRAAAGGAALPGSEAVHEFEAADELGRHRHLAPALGAALERADAQQRLLEVDIGGAQGQGFGDAAAGVRQGQGQGLDLGARGLPGGGEEAGALGGAQVFAAAPLDEAAGGRRRVWHGSHGKCLSGGRARRGGCGARAVRARRRPAGAGTECTYCVSRAELTPPRGN